MPRYSRRRSYRSSRRRSVVRRRRRSRRLNKRRFRRSLTQNAIYYKVKRVVTLSAGPGGYTRFGASLNGKILNSVAAPHGTSLWTQTGATPSVTAWNSGDVPDLNAQYDQYRIAGIQLKWYPGLPNGSVQAAYAPMAIAFDKDGIEGNVLAVDVPTLMEQTNGVTVKNAYRPWKKYFKAPKQRINTNIPSLSGVLISGSPDYRPNNNIAGQWLITDPAINTWTQFTDDQMTQGRSRGTHLLVATEVPQYDDAELPEQTMGTLVVTTYIVFKDRK